MDLSIAYENFPTEASRETVRAHVEAVSHILPGWLYELTIRMRDDGNNCATAHVDSRYARAVVQLWPGLLIRSPGEIRGYIVHEFAHIIMGGLTERVSELCENDDNLSYHMERATEDVARAIVTCL